MAHRDMTSHMLVPLRSVTRSGHLVTNINFDPAEEALSEFGAIPAGRCLHMTNATGQNEVPVCKLGCEGNRKPPVHVFRPSDAYSGGYPGPDPTVNLGPSWDTGMTRRILGYVGLEGFELATTEYDKTRSYLCGQYLRAPEVDADAANPTVDVQTVAGVLTNDTVRNGIETIVGMVSPGVPVDGLDDSRIDEYGNYVLTYYTTYRPPVEGLTETLLTALLDNFAPAQ